MSERAVTITIDTQPVIDAAEAMTRALQGLRVTPGLFQPIQRHGWEATCSLCRDSYRVTVPPKRRICPHCWVQLENIAEKSGPPITAELLTSMYRIRVNHHGIKYGQDWRNHVKNLRLIGQRQ